MTEVEGQTPYIEHFAAMHYGRDVQVVRLGDTEVAPGWAQGVECVVGYDSEGRDPETLLQACIHAPPGSAFQYVVFLATRME